MREIKTKADTDSPELTGIPTAPTPSDDTNTNQIANIEYITSKLGNTDSLPNQENHTNDLLTTDGTNPSWTDSPNISTIYERTPGTFEILSEKSKQNVFPLGIQYESDSYSPNIEYSIYTTPYTNENSKLFLSEYATVVTIPPSQGSSNSSTTEYIAIELNVDFLTITNSLSPEETQTDPFVDILLTQYDHVFTLENERIKDICITVYNLSIILLCITESNNMFIYVRNTNNTWIKYNTIAEYYQTLPSNIQEINLNGTYDSVYYENELNMFIVKDTSNRIHFIPVISNSFNQHSALTTVPFNATPTGVQIKEMSDYKIWQPPRGDIDTSVRYIGTDNKLYRINENTFQLELHPDYIDETFSNLLGSNYGQTTTGRLVFFIDNSKSKNTWSKIKNTTSFTYGIDSSGYLYAQSSTRSLGSNTGDEYIDASYIDFDVSDIFYGIKYQIQDGQILKGEPSLTVFYIKDNIIYGLERNYNEENQTVHKGISLTPVITVKNNVSELPLADINYSHIYAYNNKLYIANAEVALSRDIPYKLPNPYSLDITINHNDSISSTSRYSYDGRNLSELTINEYTHPDSGVVAGKYNTVTVNAQGHVTHGENISSFPDQTNQQNKPLITDGTNPAWSDVIDIKTINSNSDVVKINTDGSYLYGWGWNFWGNIGNGTANQPPNKFKISNTKWKDVTIFKAGTFAIDVDNLLYVWGKNSNGELGTGYTLSQYTPFKISDTKWKNVVHTLTTTFNSFITCAISLDDELYLWGKHGSLLASDTRSVQYTPVKVFHDTKWKCVHLPTNDSDVLLASTTDNKLYGWGYNINGLAGDTSTVYQYTPVKISNTNWDKIDYTYATAIATTVDGDLYAWGKSAVTTFSSITTTPFRIGFTKWKNIVLNSDDSICALNEDNYLYIWGKNNIGEVGNGTQTPQYTPRKISDTKWKKAAIAYTCFGIDENDHLYVWGGNIYGTVGNGNTQLQYTPFKISNTKWKHVIYFNNDNVMIAIDENDYLYTWGRADTLLIGNGSTSGVQTTPYKISNVTKWKKVIYGNTAIYAQSTDDELYGWGQYVRDSGYITEQLMPYLVSEKNIYKKLIVDNNTTLGITNSNNLIISNETNQLTYNDKKVLVEGDVNLPITVDENGDYVLG